MSLIKTIAAPDLTVKIYDTRIDMGRNAAADAAGAIIKMLAEKEEISMLFAAAPSQYELYIGLREIEGIDWSRINAFHMDEYIGLPADAPQCFGNYLVDNLFRFLPFKSINLIKADCEDPDEECRRYSGLISEKPIDIVCLGIGENGHIAFNDPHEAKFNDDKAVKIVELDEICRMQQVNDGCFPDLSSVPKQAMTLTIPTLIAPKHLFCVVPAKTKAKALKETIYGEINEKCPATGMRLNHNTVIYCDADSASMIL